MTYKDRLMSIRRGATQPPGESSCAPLECGQMFGVIAEGLDDLSKEVRESRKDIGAVNERIAAQEAKTHSAWHSISRIEERMNKLPREIADSIARHESACPGRDYARQKLASSTTGSMIPRPQSVWRGDDTMRITRAPANDIVGEVADAVGGLVPRWVVYAGVILGVAVVAGGYCLHSLGVLG